MKKFLRVALFVFVCVYTFDPVQVAGRKPKRTTFGSKSRVKELTDALFPGKNAKFVWLINFYKSSYCRKCVAFQSLYARVGKFIGSKKTNLKVGAIDCSKYKRRCAEHGAVDGEAFPQLKVLRGGTAHEYSGETVFSDVVRYAVSFSNIPDLKVESAPKKKAAVPDKGKRCKKGSGIYQSFTKVKNLCFSHFPGPSSKHVWLIKFYSSYDGLSRKVKNEVWAGLKTRNNAIKVGAIDCSYQKNGEVCNKYGISEYPTIKLVNKDTTESFNGNILSSQEIANWVDGFEL